MAPDWPYARAVTTDARRPSGVAAEPVSVSVLLPYRQAAATLDEAARSILAQRGVDLELIAIDDGSGDRGAAIIGGLCAIDPRVIAVSSGGVGIVGALRLGLSIARGRFIARMDADDVALPHRLARQLEYIARDASIGALGTQVEAYPDALVAEGLRRYVAWQNAIVTPADHLRELFVESPLCHPSVLLRREALESVGGWRDVAWAEDYDLWLRLAAAGWSLAKVPEVLLRWRQSSGRITFTDPRYGLDRFLEAKAEFLAPRIRNLGRPIAVWGAGPTGKRLARALERRGVYAECFVDVDPRKIGGRARGAIVIGQDGLVRGRFTVLVAVGARGARELIRTHLDDAGFVEGSDFVCAS